MSSRTIGADGNDEFRASRYAFESERMRIAREWKDVTGYVIPYRVERLPIDEQRSALEFQKQRNQPVTETICSDDSMMDYDGHNEH